MCMVSTITCRLRLCRILINRILEGLLVIRVLVIRICLVGCFVVCGHHFVGYDTPPTFYYYHTHVFHSRGGVCMLVWVRHI
jgi:hypothetical protein